MVNQQQRSSAVVVNDHMYPRPYIILTQRGHRNMIWEGPGYIHYNCFFIVADLSPSFHEMTCLL